MSLTSPVSCSIDRLMSQKTTLWSPERIETQQGSSQLLGLWVGTKQAKAAFSGWNQLLPDDLEWAWTLAAFKCICFLYCTSISFVAFTTKYSTVAVFHFILHILFNLILLLNFILFYFNWFIVVFIACCYEICLGKVLWIASLFEMCYINKATLSFLSVFFGIRVSHFTVVIWSDISKALCKVIINAFSAF